MDSYNEDASNLFQLYMISNVYYILLSSEVFLRKDTVARKRSVNH